MLAFPSVLNPSLLSPNGNDIKSTADQASWIAASNGLAGVIGFLIQSPVMQIFGRKTAYIILNSALVIGWIIFLLAQDIGALYAARIIQGLAVGGLFLNAIVVSEYCHPKRRGYFMSLKKTAQSTGALLCHSMALKWTWRQISAFAMVPCVLAIVTTLFWPESPSFLIMKGRFEDFEKSFYWLNGKSEESLKEMQIMLSAQNERVEKRRLKTRSSVTKLISKLLERDFQRAFIIVSILTLVIDACGKYYLVAYIIQIMMELMKDKSYAVYCSIGADCLTIIALCTSCFVIGRFKRRTVMFTFGGFSIFLMFSISAIRFTTLKYEIIPWLTSCFVLLHAFVVNVSIIPVCFTYFGELFPLEHRGIGFCASGIVLTCFYAVTIKLTPFLMSNTGLEGTYATYGSFLILCFLILYFLLPETKDKTLQEIEDDIKGCKRSVEVTEMHISKVN